MKINSEKVPSFLLNKIVIIIFIPIGVLLLLYYAYSIYEVKSAINWPTTKGNIISTEWKYNIIKDINTVNYKYIVEGKTYRDSEIVTDNYFSRLKKHAITVYYDPDNPATSILDVDEANKVPSAYVNYLPLTLGIIPIIVGILCLIEILYYRYKKKSDVRNN